MDPKIEVEKVEELLKIAKLGAKGVADFMRGVRLWVEVSHKSWESCLDVCIIGISLWSLLRGYDLNVWSHCSVSSTISSIQFLVSTQSFFVVFFHLLDFVSLWSFFYILWFFRGIQKLLFFGAGTFGAHKEPSKAERSFQTMMVAIIANSIESPCT